MTEIEKLIDRMATDDALAVMAAAVGKLFAHAGDAARLDFIVSLLGDSGADKISSMVNL